MSFFNSALEFAPKFVRGSTAPRLVTMTSKRPADVKAINATARKFNAYKPGNDKGQVWAVEYTGAAGCPDAGKLMQTAWTTYRVEAVAAGATIRDVGYCSNGPSAVLVDVENRARFDVTYDTAGA